MSFANIGAYAENAAIVHYSAPDKGSKKIEQRGLLLVDSGSSITDIIETS